jgi:hypothetical protein
VNAELLAVAAHELGHALVFHYAGATVAVEVQHRPCCGFTEEIDVFETRDLDRALDYLAAPLAGQIAGNRWRALHGLFPEDGDQSAEDRRLFHRNRYGDHFDTGGEQIPRWFDVTQAEARAEALINLVWPQLVVLVPELARRGRLTSKDF